MSSVFKGNLRMPWNPEIGKFAGPIQIDERWLGFRSASLLWKQSSRLPYIAYVAQASSMCVV
jgi:hypothetical protein